MSIDFTHSGVLAVNTLIELFKNGRKQEVTFDFIDNVLRPSSIDTEENRLLLSDYKTWLPVLFESHNCDLSKIEVLMITITTNFEQAVISEGMDYAIEFTLSGTVKWKATDRKEEKIELSEKELINKTYLKTGIPAVT